MSKKTIIGLVAFVALLLIGIGCSKADSVPLEVDLLQLIIMDKKDKQGRYEVQIMEEGATAPKPYAPIKHIEHFDQVYREGFTYKIIVKRIREKGETRYIWTEKSWGEAKQE